MMRRQPVIRHASALIAGAVIVLASAFCYAQAIRNRVTYPQSDITLDVTAITFPNDERIKVGLLGTAQFNNLKGTAIMSREKGKSVTLVKLDIGRLPQPAQVCQACATYVAWAVTPEGQADNLGEFRKRGSHTLDGWFGSDMETATRHQTFSVIVTAEPYYLVASPSRNVVATNTDPASSEGGGSIKVDRNTISFSGDSDVDNKVVSPSPASEAADKKFPVELREARFALEIARFYQAGRFDARTYNAAEASFKEAQHRYQQNAPLEQVLPLADLAVRQADMARRRATSLARADKDRQQIQDRDDAFAALELTLKEKDRNLKDSEGARREVADRNKQLEADLANARDRASHAETTLAAAQSTNARLQSQVDSLVAEKSRLEATVNDMGSRSNQATKCIGDVEDANKRNRDRVSREFKVSKSDQGFVLSLPEHLFAIQQPNVILPQALLKIDLLADYLKPLNNQITIETFATGCGNSCQELTDTWARTLAEYLEAQGVSRQRITATGRGQVGGSTAAQRNRAKPAAVSGDYPQMRVTIREE
jgi:outer membrane protein OmpA-like peptidoglycan-associated protein